MKLRHVSGALSCSFLSSRYKSINILRHVSGVLDDLALTVVQFSCRELDDVSLRRCRGVIFACRASVPPVDVYMHISCINSFAVRR